MAPAAEGDDESTRPSAASRARRGLGRGARLRRSPLAKSTASRLRPLATRRFELLVRAALLPGLVLSREVGVEQVARGARPPRCGPARGPDPRRPPRAVGLGRSRELAERLEIAPPASVSSGRRRRRDRDASSRSPGRRQGARLREPRAASIRRGLRARRAERRRTSSPAELRAPREREARDERPPKTLSKKIGHQAQEPTLSPSPPDRRSRVPS